MAKRGAFRFVGIGSHLSQCQSESVKTFSIVSHYLYLLQDIYADTSRHRGTAMAVTITDLTLYFQECCVAQQPYHNRRWDFHQLNIE
jgi:hypothetical protein